MFIRICFVFLLCSFLPSFSFSEDLSTKIPRWKQLSHTYGFILGQDFTLNRIEQEYPDLSREIQEAKRQFSISALGEGAKGLEPELSLLLGEKWKSFKVELLEEIQKRLAEQVITKESAINFLKEVEKRSRGELNNDILSTILSTNKRYQDNPGQELVEGWKQTYRTKGHPKSKGSDISVSFPLSWSKREGDRPNVIQFFQSGAGYGPIMVTLMVKDLGLPVGTILSKNDLKEFFTPNEMKDMVPEGSTFVEAKSITLENLPAGMLVCDKDMERLDFKAKIRMTQFQIICKNQMYILGFMLTKQQDSADSLDTLQSKYFPTFRVIANTLVINDNYE